jgi:hypothetical protein
MKIVQFCIPRSFLPDFIWAIAQEKRVLLQLSSCRFYPNLRKVLFNVPQEVYSNSSELKDRINEKIDLPVTGSGGASIGGIASYLRLCLV